MTFKTPLANNPRRCACNHFWASYGFAAAEARNSGAGLGVRVQARNNYGLSAATDRGYAGIVGSFRGANGLGQFSQSNGVFGTTIAGRGSGVFGWNTSLEGSPIVGLPLFGPPPRNRAGVTGDSADGVGVVGIGSVGRGVFAQGRTALYARGVPRDIMALSAKLDNPSYEPDDRLALSRGIDPGRAGRFDGDVDIQSITEIWAPPYVPPVRSTKDKSPRRPPPVPPPLVLALDVHGGASFRAITTDGVFKNTNQFLLDHPLLPETKFLAHSVVESPEMKTFYDGVVTADEAGEAVVTMPSYFQSLNREFRYLLSSIGTPAPSLHVKHPMEAGRFVVGGAVPHSTVSWQVTAVRTDPWAQANPMSVEIQKNAASIGKYRNPRVYGHSAERKMRDFDV